MLEHVSEVNKEQDFYTSPKSLDDYMFEEKAKMYALAFEQQFHYAVYYAYMKLKEQEIRNICWLADLVTFNAAKNYAGWRKIVIPFKDVY